MKNCRIQLRYSLEGTCIADAKVVLGKYVYPVEMINISRGGTFVKLPHTLPCGAEIELSFTLPEGGQQCHIPCVVRWTKENTGAGLQFRHLHAVELWGLNRLIQDLSTLTA